MRASVRNTTKEILGLPKAELDANWLVLEISVSSELFHIIDKWISTENIQTYTYYNKKNGHTQRYTAKFSIRRVFFEDKEYFKVLSTGASGSVLPNQLEEMTAKTPSMNDMFRFIMQKYPGSVFSVKYSKADSYDTPIAF